MLYIQKEVDDVWITVLTVGEDIDSAVEQVNVLMHCYPESEYRIKSNSCPCTPVKRDVC